jgi:hypothetical protein
MPMAHDDRAIRETEDDFRREGESAATWLAISFLMAREAQRDPTFLTEICSMFDAEFAELGLSQNHEYMAQMRVMARRYFQLMVTTAEILAKEANPVANHPSAAAPPRNHRTE